MSSPNRLANGYRCSFPPTARHSDSGVPGRMVAQALPAVDVLAGEAAVLIVTRQ